MTVIDLVRLLRRNLALLLVCGLVGIAAAAAYVFTRPVQYVAESTAMVVAGDSSSVGGAMSGNTIAQQRASAYSTLVGTAAVDNRVRATLNKQGLSKATDGTLSAKVVTGTSFIRITATGSSAQNAQALANAALVGVQAEALRMETYSQAQANPGYSQAQLEKLTAIHVLSYEPAGLPATPKTANLPLYLALGLLAGLVLGGVISVIKRMFDVKIRSQKDVEDLTGHGVMAVIPEDRQLTKQRKSGDLELAGIAGEAFRQLRTNLRFINVDHPPKAVVVTSANPGEGKSTVCSYLARSVARSGQATVLVDADMRRPMQHTAFSIDSHVGLSQVLAGDVSLEDALNPTDVPGMRVLVAGRIPPNPSELLGSVRMHNLIARLTKAGYFVILDAPPLLAVTDAGLLATSTDGVIMVNVVGGTHKEQVTLCTKRLEQVGAVLLGSVLTRAPKKAMGDVLYGYGAGSFGYSSYNAYYTDENGKKKRRKKRMSLEEDYFGRVELAPVNSRPTEDEPTPSRVTSSSASRSQENRPADLTPVGPRPRPARRAR
ncbi:capsular biosynthesis protein [Acidipropionibacterium acidipropionici]|uniref:Capsular biosynthesis protein n=1 Tax=Acidipropionibacterium acidipropionici TaxID=1748 RepID=A0AAC9ANW6_9ACTN|nr:CpsD/CapB family tyrosine-protein kinase [Acidipropionibacterium acidipropionici]AMS06099.1 capsular biosynthesis protein [Acidipropionibacterium acidipropionici]AOZ47562.1 capsular biosynthesis protein [Acidipropionibacterium acidipropionici]AZP39115.1 capsular biosynthesis protein [Acidipropionibacterium acidipropionici]